ncbi:MAG: glycosyltransferase family 1 protein [Candidatus Lokiarchaeota archaeon]|nr:glycosyltransferase family 1 protein [Candidatus Harpocratesius repetitus]
MKIAIYLGTFKKNHDGVARATYNLVDSFLANNNKVFVASPLITPQLRKNLTLFQFPSIPIFFYPEYKFGIPIGRFFRKLNQFKPDIIHIATPDLIGLILSLYARIQNIPHVFIHHSDVVRVFQYYKMGFLERSINWMYRTFYNKACAVFTPTLKIKDDLEKLGIHRVFLWSRGIDRTQFHPSFRNCAIRNSWKVGKRKVILYTGRLVWYKDLLVIAEVYRLFQSKFPSKSLFVLAGDGPIRHELEELMPEAIFLGYIEDKMLSQVFASADIFLFPSTTETFGQVVQEALASGIPAIVSDIGGCQEIIQESNAGLVVHAKKPKLFFQACLQLINNDDLYNKFCQNALNFSENRSWEYINKEIIKKYQKIVRICKNM